MKDTDLFHSDITGWYLYGKSNREHIYLIHGISYAYIAGPHEDKGDYVGRIYTNSTAEEIIFRRYSSLEEAKLKLEAILALEGLL